MRFPTIVFVQGAGWGRQDLGQWMLALAEFARRGYVVAIVQHRPSEVAPFPAALDDVRAAAEFLRAEADRFRVDTDRMALWGDSSGGHLVLLAALAGGGTPAIRAVVDFYGPTDLSRMPEDPAVDALLRGVDPRVNPEAAHDANPIAFVEPAAERPLPPLLVVHGSDDDVVPFEQSALLCDVLTVAGHHPQFYRLEGAGHGTGAFFARPMLDIVDRFLTGAFAR